MLLTCAHCGYKWDYRGECEYYATCPRCRYKVKIPEDKIEQLRTERGVGGMVGGMLEKRPVKLLGVAGVVNRVVEEYQYEKSKLIQILLKLQRNFGWLSKEMLIEVSKQLNVPLNQVYHVATFYKAFSLVPRGRHLIRVCMGTSCKVRGAPLLLDRTKSLLGIEEDETSPDGRFTLTTVNCLGCCAIGPIISVDGDYYEHVRVEDVKRILSKYQ